MVLIVSVITTPVFADVEDEVTPSSNEILSVEEFIDEDGTVYEFTMLANPVTFKAGTAPGVLLGYAEVKGNNSIEPHDEYHETVTYKIYDYGVIEAFVNMSNPYFVASVAGGATVTQTWSKTFTIATKFSSDIPTSARNMVAKALKGEFSYNTQYTYKFERKLSGPPSGVGSLYYWYKLGYHKHSIVITTERRYQGTLISSVDLSTVGYEPAYDWYSEIKT